MEKKNDPEDAIWIVDDDDEDHDLVREIFKELNQGNPLQFFNSGDSLLNSLKKVEVAPFIIICDVNLPRMDGFELREQLLKTPNNKFHSVPFIFWSSQASEGQIRKAYKLRGHGFFIKEPKYEEWKASLIRIVQYWQKSRTPSKEDKPDQPEI
jgi:CheY-like chemotaxis protein